MGKTNYSEGELIDLIKRLAGVDRDADLVEYLNARYGEGAASKQKLTNFRSSKDKKLTLTKMFLLELAQRLESIRHEERRQPGSPEGPTPRPHRVPE